MKFTLVQKGILLVSIPLAFELVFVSVLSSLHSQAEEAAFRAFRSLQIGGCAGKLISDIFAVGSTSKGEIGTNFTSDIYQRAVVTIKADLSELAEAVKDDPAQLSVVQRSYAACQEAGKLLSDVKQEYEAGNSFAALDRLNSSSARLRSCIKSIVSPELIAMANSEKAKEKVSRENHARLRRYAKAALTIGVGFNIVLTVLLALFFSKSIAERLKILADNSFRLAGQKPLNQPIPGNDEIASVDRSFHGMAAALAEAKQKEKSLVEHSLDVICSLDKNGRFATINPACSQIFGSSEDELLGANLKTFLIEEDVEHYEKSISEAMTGKSEIQFETRIKPKAGQVTDLDWAVHWVPTEKRFFCVAHDISERKEVERLKQRFMSMISHDLRTPLSVMKNYFELSNIGLCGELNERGEYLLKLADRNASRMLSLINDLLDLEKSETGRLSVNPSAVGLNEVLDECLKSIASLASKQEVNLELHPPDLTVFADPHRLAQVLVNLVANAIKFSPKGGTVKVWAEAKDDMALIHVSDQGRGVPDHLKEVIFERFHQVEVADALEKGGSGLGLAICKMIVELHGGNIKVENNQDCGSIFSFTIPAALPVGTHRNASEVLKNSA